MRRVARLVVLAVTIAVALAACGRESAAAKGAEDAIRASFAAEGNRDVKAFLALWTDKGLESYDVGTRKDLENPSSEAAKRFGEDKARVVRIVDTTVKDDRATVLLDAALVGKWFAGTLYRLKYEVAKNGEDWKLDGFEFVGSPPPKKGTHAVEYAFALSRSQAGADFALKFSNKGKQQHELAFFKGPDGTDVATAKKALEHVDGGTLEAPKGYQSDHLSFAEPGESHDVTFAGPLPAGTYFFACYIPEGGMNENGEPKNPKGKPHIQLGMINRLIVK
jgi:hypothetical protein